MKRRIARSRDAVTLEFVTRRKELFGYECDDQKSACSSRFGEWEPRLATRCRVENWWGDESDKVIIIMPF